MSFIKDFSSFLNEAEGYNGKGIFTVATLSQKNLFVCEISGQLSDGAWENSKPYDHWEPWSDSEVKVGSNVGRDFPVKKDGYNLSSLIQYVGDTMLAVGAAGAAGWDLGEISWTPEHSAVENFFAASSVAALERMTISEDFEQHFQKFKGSKNSYTEAGEKNKKKLEDTWNAIKSGRYGMKQLTRDLTDISKAMKIYKRNIKESEDSVNEGIDASKKIINGIFRKNGIKPLTTQSSGMVRGWTTYHGKGYKYEYSGLVTLKGFTKEEMEDIAKQFEDAGIKVNRIHSGSIEYTEVD